MTTQDSPSERLSLIDTWNFLRDTTNLIWCTKNVDGVWIHDQPSEKNGIRAVCYKAPELNIPAEGEEYGIWRLENLTMPKTELWRCGILDMSFRNTLLTDSFLCWNDFADVDFTDAILEGCDMRRCTFENVRFVRADLRGADLRMSSFENCDFSNANMAGTKMRRSQAKGIGLSNQQKQQIDWKHREGEEPPGG